MVTEKVPMSRAYVLVIVTWAVWSLAIVTVCASGAVRV